MLAHTLTLYLPLRVDTAKSHAFFPVGCLVSSERAAFARGGLQASMCFGLALPLGAESLGAAIGGGVLGGLFGSFS